MTTTTTLSDLDDHINQIVDQRLKQLLSQDVTIAGNLTVNGISYFNSTVEVWGPVEGEEIVLRGVDDNHYDCHFDVVPDNRVRFWSQRPYGETYEVMSYNLKQDLSGSIH